MLEKVPGELREKLILEKCLGKYMDNLCWKKCLVNCMKGAMQGAESRTQSEINSNENGRPVLVFLHLFQLHGLKHGYPTSMKCSALGY